MGETIRSVLIGTSPLAVLLGLATVVGLRRPLAPDPAARRAAARALLVCIAAQALHFGEEFATGFHHRYPELLSLAPWPATFFVTFNLTWLGIWLLAARALPANARAARVVAWFLACGSIANGVAHPLMALAAGGYFPGVVTCLPSLLAGVFLARRLR